jgi:hypothetical protein
MNTFIFVSLLICAVAEDMPVKENSELQGAERNYKTQMQYQGQYPEEAIALKKEYKAQVARIKSKFNGTTPEAVMFLATSDSTAMQAALQNAKEDYVTQMHYQGQYPEEAAELKDQYEKKVARIKSEYASKGSPLTLLSEGACGDEESDLQEALNNYKIQKGFQGAYPKEAAELKEEYDSQVRRIKSLYASNVCGSSVMLLASPSCGDEDGHLHEARQNYKIQMFFQGAYPEEAEELKQDYAQKVTKIKAQYAACHSGEATDLGLAATRPSGDISLVLFGTAAISSCLGAVFAYMFVRKTEARSTPLLA